MIIVIGFKIFKLLIVLLKYLISQLSMFMTATLHTALIFILVSKLILEFFFQIKYFGLKLEKGWVHPTEGDRGALTFEKIQVNPTPC